MARNRTIIDCYTDEPAGLGVPPYLGVWPRYAAGRQKKVPTYLTIDDLRIASYKKKLKEKDVDSLTGRTRIDLINNTRSQEEVKEILEAGKPTGINDLAVLALFSAAAMVIFRKKRK